ATAVHRRRVGCAYPSLGDRRAQDHVAGVSGGVGSPGGGARCAAWSRYAPPPINAATITSATSTSSTVNECRPVARRFSPVTGAPIAGGWGAVSGAYHIGVRVEHA